MNRTVVLVSTLIVGLFAGDLLADEADGIIAQVLRTTHNRAKAAGELVERATAPGGAPAVRVRLCEKAYECGITAPAGYASAVAALDLLAEIAPDRAEAWGLNRLVVYRLRYFRGDRRDRFINGAKYVEALLARAGRLGRDNKWSEAAKLYGLASGVAKTLGMPKRPAISELLRDASGRAAAFSRLAGLKAAVARRPDDAACRKRLVETYLIDLDMPPEAAKYLGDGLAPTLRKNTSLATREASELADADFLTLGQWYRSLAARTADKATKARLLARGRDYLRMYLEVYTAKDSRRLGAAGALKGIETELKRFETALAAKIARLRGLTLKLSGSVTLKLVRIEAGRFMMGSAKISERYAKSLPQHQVTISTPFYMGVTEVTQAQYAAITGNDPSSFIGPLNPVNEMSWNDAAAFCKVLSRKTGRTVRLPTEAEWEYACRAGTKTAFSFGNSKRDLGAYGWCRDNSGKKTRGVAQAKPNRFGLYDMHGNVMEWCSDRYAETYANAGTRDPTGPKSGGLRVLRGGSWAGYPDYCRSAGRRADAAVCRDNRYGFRVAVACGR